MISRKRSKRKVSGGLYMPGRKNRKSESGRVPIMTVIGETKKRVQRVLGGNKKQKTIKADTLNLFDGKAYVKAKIKNVVENNANRNFIRMNILTKGSIVETDKGKAKITSRPGQSSSISGVLIK